MHVDFVEHLCRSPKSEASNRFNPFDVGLPVAGPVGVRQHPRRCAKLPVLMLDARDRSCSLATRNISVSGAFLEADGIPLPEAGSEVTLIFEEPNTMGRMHPIKARVQRKTSGGLAVIFIHFTLDDMDVVDAACRAVAQPVNPRAAPSNASA